MSQEILLHQTADPMAAVQAVVAELEQGRLAVLPDDCGWIVCGLATSPRTASQLEKYRSAGDPVLLLSEPVVAEDYVDDPSKNFVKLATRCWPGPLILRDGVPRAQGLAKAWPPDATQWALTPTGQSFACPADGFTHLVLRSSSAPLLGVLSTSREIPRSPEISFIVRQKEVRYPEGPTVAWLDGDQIRVERAGVVSERMLSRQSGEVYLFVCTGNTCRSPMAEAIFRRMLSERLKCREDELIDRGFAVISAGLAASRGSAASPEAVDLLRRDGIDLSAHESQPVTEELLFHCDHIITMTKSHRDAVLSAYPELHDHVRLLSPDFRDVSDPIGAGLDEYERCREEIEDSLATLLEEIRFGA